MLHMYTYKTLQKVLCHTVRAGSAKKTGNLLMGVSWFSPKSPPLPAISATRAWDSNRRFTLACVVVRLGSTAGGSSSLFTQYHDLDFKNKVHFLSFPSQEFTDTRKLNATSEVACPGSHVCSLSKQPPRDASGSEQVPWAAERTENGNRFPGLLGFSSASKEGRSCLLLEGQGRSQRVLAELCQGFCLES